MAEQTQTEKLKENILKALTNEGVIFSWDEEMVNVILKACKEAGLKFVIKHIADPYDITKEIEI